jgi:hypothetical protein
MKLPKTITPVIVSRYSGSAGNRPNFPQGNLERAAAISTNFRDREIEVILIPEALMGDQYGGARMDR